MNRGAALVAVLVFAAGSLQLSRAGYSVDEEFTFFAVRGIEAHGVPTLPSGLLYDRGLAYSYASWLAGSIAGSDLPAFRAVSLISAALAVFLSFTLVRRIATHRAALIASILIAASIPFWATATTARFYAPFLAVCLAYLICLTHRSYWIPLVLLAAAARLTHELGFTVAALPFAAMLVASGDRTHWLKVLLVTIAGLAGGQLVLFALHAIEPSSGETMVRQFFLWQVLNLFERPGDRQFAIALIVMVVGVLFAPARWRLWVVSSACVAVMILAYSIARASNAEPITMSLLTRVVDEGSRYPLDMARHILRTTPITLTLALAALGVRLFSGQDWPAAQRAAHLLWIAWVLWFGVIDSGITVNYLLLPLSFMLIAIAIDLDAIAGSRKIALVAIALLIAGVALDQWRGEGGPVARLETARPTINIAGIEEIRATLQPTDRVVCTDELGCLMLVGRIDRWLALDDFVRERFLVKRGKESGTGVYTGVPAILRPAEVFGPNPDGSLPDRTLVVDIFKDYPIGNSRSWLPKAIEEDGLQVTPLLETPQARVLQVSPPERLAHLR